MGCAFSSSRRTPQHQTDGLKGSIPTVIPTKEQWYVRLREVMLVLAAAERISPEAGLALR